MTTKNSFVRYLVIGALLAGGVGIARAQAPASPNTPTTQIDSSNAATPASNNDGTNTVRTLSGCLQEGAGANEYTLFGSDANSWELKSNRVDLGAHVGQAVTVEYVASPDAKASAGASSPLIVTNLMMVSSNCSW